MSGLFNLNKNSVISSRSSVIAILSGELLELQVRKSFLFQKQYDWIQSYLLLTSIGIFKFKGLELDEIPDYIPLSSITSVTLLEDDDSSLALNSNFREV